GLALTIVGKGITYDTGGLNLKPGSSMRLMKKDMGGAAHALGLAKVIMQLDLPIRLRVLIPAAENAIGPGAFRPGDVVRSRSGVTVEIDNTDAEGRLVLADALTYASEASQSADLTFTMATLTGAARVAVGPSIVPYLASDSELMWSLHELSKKNTDPIWPLPLFEPYEAYLDSDVADLVNSGGGGFAGAITAALFLKRFVGSSSWAHFDLYGWNPVAKPGRPKGAAAQGLLSLVSYLESWSNV
ncbi:MAG: leucyl aminopeptidase family protein, partial [Alphaproteobacteria bacterium]